MENDCIDFWCVACLLLLLTMISCCQIFLLHLNLLWLLGKGHCSSAALLPLVCVCACVCARVCVCVCVCVCVWMWMS